MPPAYLDRYGRAQSLCHRLPPLVKLWLAFAVVLVVVSLPVKLWPLQAAMACLVFAGHSLANIPLSYLARRLAIFLPMLLVLSLSLPLSQGFATGWEMMMAVLFRSTVSFLVGLWLINVMPFDQLLATLRRLKVPVVLLAVAAFMYRYFFVLWDELQKMRTARRARTFGTQGRRFQWKLMSQLIGMLLIRAMQRAERVHGAMCARGWDGHIRTLDDVHAP